jgi:hypothetical protein
MEGVGEKKLTISLTARAEFHLLERNTISHRETYAQAPFFRQEGLGFFSALFRRKARIEPDGNKHPPQNPQELHLQNHGRPYRRGIYWEEPGRMREIRREVIETAQLISERVRMSELGD